MYLCFRDTMLSNPKVLQLRLQLVLQNVEDNLRGVRSSTKQRESCKQLNRCELICSITNLIVKAPSVTKYSVQHHCFGTFVRLGVSFSLSTMLNHKHFTILLGT